METAPFFFEWQSICSSCAKQETVLPLHVLVVPPQMGKGKTVDSGLLLDSVGKKELKQETWRKSTMLKWRPASFLGNLKIQVSLR